MAKKALKKTTIKKTPIKKSVSANESGSTPPNKVTRDQLLSSFLNAYGKNGSNEGEEAFSNLITKRLLEVADKHIISKKYNILVFYDDAHSIMSSDSDRIYNAVKSFQDSEKPLLLIIYSRGGEPGAAYLIGKLCREFSHGDLHVAVPRRAKSAATLISCAANQIHMGSLSHLGPIDPQFDGMPALGLKNSIEHIAELAGKNKNSVEMFARYMQLSIKPIQIGYYERVAESAEQYAVRLLSEHANTLNRKPDAIAHELVHDYKDHSFVIDKTEATRIFGEKTIVSDSPEYELSNEVYEVLSMIEHWVTTFDRQMYFIGSLNSGIVISKN